MTRPPREKDNTEFGQVCWGWWAQLTNRDIGRSRADLARLRRVSTPVEAVMIPAVQDLHRRLLAIGHDLSRDVDRLALIALTLAHVKTGSGPRLAQRMGQGEPKALSPLRFDRLIRSTDPAGLTTQLRRALAVVGHGADVAALARDLRWWTDTTRARWCFDYYGAAHAAPDDPKDMEAET